MNRRSFIGKLGTIAAAFSILPAATNYARNWKFTKTLSGIWVINPEWVNAPYELAVWAVDGNQFVSGWIERGREPGIHPPGCVERIHDSLPLRASFPLPADVIESEGLLIIRPFKQYE